MSKFTVKQICYFSAAHVLRGYPLACEKLHGHNYKVIIEVGADELDELGMVMDYVEIENAASKHIKVLDHHYLNELEPFTTINPTAENVAKWLFDKIKPNINNGRAMLKSITIWETDHNCVTYKG